MFSYGTAIERGGRDRAECRWRWFRWGLVRIDAFCWGWGVRAWPTHSHLVTCTAPTARPAVVHAQPARRPGGAWRGRWCLFGHAQVGCFAARIQQRNALRTHLGNEAAGFGDATEQERPLIREIGPLLERQVLGVDHRVV